METQKRALANEMIQGRISDFNKYQKNVGIAEGLTVAQSTIDDVLKKLDREDE